MKSLRILGIAGPALVAVIAFACGGDDAAGSPTTATNQTPASAVTVELTNWAIKPSSGVLAAGKVSFTAVHETMHSHGDEGGATHQLLVARLDDGSKAGASKFSDVVLNLADIKMGESKTGEANLTPGAYELVCLVVEQVGGKTVSHYEKGMYTTITVR